MLVYFKGDFISIYTCDSNMGGGGGGGDLFTLALTEQFFHCF